MNTDSRLLWGLLVLIIIAILVGIFARPFKREPVNTSEDIITEGTESNSYFNETLGIYFTFPQDYVLVEINRPFEQGELLALVLYDQDDYLDLRNSNAEAREAPPSITLEVFENSKILTSREWVEQADRSNFRLGPQLITTTHVGGEDSIRYSWSGLYEAQSVAVAYRSRVFLFSVTYLDAESVRIDDFERVLSSVRFE